MIFIAVPTNIIKFVLYNKGFVWYYSKVPALSFGVSARKYFLRRIHPARYPA